jgi:hypothetical protein
MEGNNLKLKNKKVIVFHVAVINETSKSSIKENRLSMISKIMLLSKNLLSIFEY